MIWKAIMMLVMGFAATWLSARLSRRIVHNEPLAAAAYCLVLSALAVVATTLYVNDLKTAPFLVIGNSFGTYVSVATDKRGRRAA